jgi:propionyl-CoA synthetase
MSHEENLKKYNELHQLSLNNPEEFWTPIANEIFWYKKWDKVLDDSNPPFYKWFVGGKTNTCYNAVDRWAEKFPDKPAYIAYCENGDETILSYKQLLVEVNKFASVLKDLGVGKGDRIIIYLPMIMEAAVAMLACVRIGAIHSVVFAGFSVRSLSVRIDDSEPKVLICSDGGIRAGKNVTLKDTIVDETLETANFKVPHVVVVNRGIAEHKMKEGTDQYWSDLMDAKSDNTLVEPEVMESTDPSYILYTSGTTGMPKGVLRDTGGHIVALYHSMKSIFNTDTDQVYFATSDIGWVVGHSYIIYGPLFKGCTSIIYEGTPVYPEPNAWFKIISKYKVNTVFSAPTAFRILRKFDEKFITENDLSSLKTIYLAGEPLDKPTFNWMASVLKGVDVIDNYWQTETGWPILANPWGITPLKVKPGSPTKPAWGWNLLVVDSDGNEVEKGTKGFLVAIPPTPPGVLLTVYKNDDRYVDSYYKAFHGKNYYATGDYAIEDEDGYFFVLGRADEVIKVAGHRLGTGEMEAIFTEHPAVAEVCCIGIADEVKGEVPISLLVLKEGFYGSEALENEMKNLIREKLGPVATPKAIYVVDALPKTRSGKIIRRAIKGIAEGKGAGDLSTIEDRSVIDKIKEKIEK